VCLALGVFGEVAMGRRGSGATRSRKHGKEVWGNTGNCRAQRASRSRQVERLCESNNACSSLQRGYSTTPSRPPLVPSLLRASRTANIEIPQEPPLTAASSTKLRHSVWPSEPRSMFPKSVRCRRPCRGGVGWRVCMDVIQLDAVN